MYIYFPLILTKQVITFLIHVQSNLVIFTRGTRLKGETVKKHQSSYLSSRVMLTWTFKNINQSTSDAHIMSKY